MEVRGGGGRRWDAATAAATGTDGTGGRDWGWRKAEATTAAGAGRGLLGASSGGLLHGGAVLGFSFELPKLES